MSVAPVSRWALKAIVYTRYGAPDVLQLKEVDRPEPRPGEVLVRVHATTVSAADWRMRRPSPFIGRLYNGLLRPKRATILGFELAGRVEAVGERVTRFKAGHDVFALTGVGFGAYAEYRCLPETGRWVGWHGLIARKPTTLTYEEAAAVPVGGLTAQGFLRRARAASGESILIYGASGSVGTFAVQLAKHAGCRVTAVCSATNRDLVTSLGADEVIDYTREDFASRGRAYDVVFDAVGKVSSARARNALKQGGRCVSVRSNPGLERGDLDRLRELLEAGTLRAVIDRRYPMEDIQEAHTYVEAGHKKGNVVITMA